MQEEYLDIVDENGNLTGEKELRSVVHEKGLWHKTVHIYFYRIKDGTIEILVHLRSKFKDQYPNLWDTRFGGHVDSNKSVEETLEKEMREETGLRVKPEAFLKGSVWKYDGGKNREFFSIYYYNFLGNKKELSFDDGEVQKVKWMNEREILQSIELHPEIRAAGKSGFLDISQDLKSKL